MRPKKFEDAWYIEVFTEEFGYVFLLKKEEASPIPITFATQEEAWKHIQGVDINM